MYKKEKLSSLALMHIHYQVKNALVEVEAGARDHSEELVRQYFDVSFFIVKLVLYNLIQTGVFDKCKILFLPCTLPLQFLMYYS